MLVTVQPLKGKTAEEIPQDLKANMERLSGYDIAFVERRAYAKQVAF
jgi:hypothetical protein